MDIKFVITEWPPLSILTIKKPFSRLLAIVCLLAISGCSYIVSSTTQNLAHSLSSAIINNDDLKTVEQGLPAYLLLLDGLIEDDPKNADLLQAASRLNSTYASIFTNNKQQAKRLTDKAFDFSIRAICISKKKACAINNSTFEEFKAATDLFTKKDIALLYTLGSSWASRIEAHSDDWNAIAEISRVQYIMEHVVILDEMHESGTAHLYLGTLATLLPPAMGGKPDVGRKHFERAIALSEGKNLMAKVTFARRYARLLFERPLHDRLLKEVLDAPAQAPGFTLANTLAQRDAQALLESADEYF